jgi:hypothetical protein
LSTAMPRNIPTIKLTAPAAIVDQVRVFVVDRS